MSRSQLLKVSSRIAVLAFPIEVRRPGHGSDPVICRPALDGYAKSQARKPDRKSDGHP
jgi:hypothetical protein